MDYLQQRIAGEVAKARQADEVARLARKAAKKQAKKEARKAAKKAKKQLRKGAATDLQSTMRSRASDQRGLIERVDLKKLRKQFDAETDPARKADLGQRLQLESLRKAAAGEIALPAWRPGNS